jgi:hypothetical protein
MKYPVGRCPPTDRVLYDSILELLPQDRKLHQIVYGDVDPPRRGKARGNFLTYQQICQLIRKKKTDMSAL